MIDADDVLRRLLSATKIDRASLASVTTEQGVYVLWLAEEQHACLKVGIAGPRRGKGLRERLRNHSGSDTSNSVLARHLAADCTSRWCHGRDFNDRAQRRAFITDGCYFQAVAVRTETRREQITGIHFAVVRVVVGNQDERRSILAHLEACKAMSIPSTTIGHGAETGRKSRRATRRDRPRSEQDS